jgi:hypothetical protein
MLVLGPDQWGVIGTTPTGESPIVCTTIGDSKEVAGMTATRGLLWLPTAAGWISVDGIIFTDTQRSRVVLFFTHHVNNTNRGGHIT